MSSVSHSPLPGSQVLKEAAGPFRTALADWYQKHHRRLPWRTKPSLYRTVVSEFMLQQTRIETALPFFDRWMIALPDFASLAEAREEQVLKLWEGLGYYRRARNLHRLAKELVAMSMIPALPEEWRKFPGVGPYSAAAITSITFHAPAACVDGNVVRVLARLTAFDRPLKDASYAARLLQPLAQHLLDPADPGAHNQAMMELGATACQRVPDCAVCPVATFCEGRRTGKALHIPDFPARQTEKISVTRIWAERDGKLLLAQSGRDASRLAQLYELPACEQAGLTPTQVSNTGTFIAKRKRSITRFSITESIYLLAEHEFKSPPDGLSWIPLANLDTIAFSGPHRRWINEILMNQAPEVR